MAFQANAFQHNAFQIGAEGIAFPPDVFDRHDNFRQLDSQKRIGSKMVLRVSTNLLGSSTVRRKIR